MRPDVKLGIVVSMVFVTVAGTYFLVQDRGESAIPVSSDPTALAGAADKTPPDTATRATTPTKRSTNIPAPNPALRTASRENLPVAPAGNRKTNTTPSRDRNASRQERFAAGSSANRGPATSVQSRRSRNGLAAPRKQARRKQPKQQLALTATPGTGVDTAIERHRVQRGDTMATLAKQYYGSTQFAEFLISQNKQLADPARLRVGEIVKIVPRSTDSEPSGARPANASQTVATPVAREYRIKSGDSFYRIARDVLGDASRWNELFELNKKTVGSDPAKLKIGQVIVLPRK